MAYQRKKTIGFLYHGESKEELANKLEGKKYEDSMISDKWQLDPTGVIGVGGEYKDSWIYGLKSFGGWNITHCQYSVRGGKMSTFPFGKEWDMNRLKALREKKGRQLTPGEMDTCLISGFSSYEDSFVEFGKGGRL